MFTDERSLQNNVKIGAVPSSINNVLLYQYGGSYPLAITKDYGTDTKHTITSVLNVNEYTLFPSDDLDKTNDIYNDYYELYIAEGDAAGYKSVISSYTYDSSTNTVTVVPVT